MDVARIGLAHETVDVALDRLRRVRGRGRRRSTARSASWPTCPVPRSGPGTSPRVGWCSTTAISSASRPVTGRARPRWCRSTTTTCSATSTTATRSASATAPWWSRPSATTATASRCGSSTAVPLTGRPGVHIPSDRLRLSTPTAEDLVMLDAFVEAGVDMVAISFVRSAHDVRRVGVEPHPRGPLVVAKIETRAAVENLEGIIEASGAVMVARGDLGSEMPDRGAAAPPEADPAPLHRARAPGHHRHPDARVDGARARPRPAPRPPTSPTRCSTARRRSCCRARPPSATTR